MSGTGSVQVDHHQFSVGAIAADTLDTRDEGTLIQVGPGFVTVLTGIAYGPVTVTVMVTGAAPDDDLAAWEAVEETTVESATEIQVMRLDGRIEPEFDAVPPGRYRFRAHARGRDTNWDLEVSEPCEQYRLVLWPTTDTESGILHLRKTDAAYSPPAKILPTPDYSYAYLLDPDGGVQRVPHEDPAVRAVHERIRTWGGRAPGPALTDGFGIYDAQFLAGLDRDLVDAIENLPEDRLWSLTRWCAHRAFEHAGLAQFPDFRAALTAMDDGTPATAPPDFVNSSQARWRIDTDPDIPVTIVSGLPGSSEQIQQHQAIATYFAATEFDNPLKAAFNAVRFAATTYGMDYRELFTALRAEFLTAPTI